MIEPLLLTTTRVRTFLDSQPLSTASGFFFRRHARLHLVTCRHVFANPGTGHAPDRVEIDVHVDPTRLGEVHTVSLGLYLDGRARWRDGRDAGGAIDVATLEIDESALPMASAWRCFTPEHLLADLDDAQVGAPLLIVGFPLGFYDQVHFLPVVRQAVIASSFGVRFQGEAQFLTDARTHRGSSGGPVVLHDPHADPVLPWKLLGVHASRIDMASRDRYEDEALGLNSAWYADILMTLTADGPLAGTSNDDRPDGGDDAKAPGRTQATGGGL